MATNPGNTGTKLHNTLFKILKLNNIYLPFKVKSNKSAKNIIQNLNFSGCSLSMPFKETLVSIVDRLDKSAAEIKSINTILKKNNKLIGYNTDYYAALKILKKININKNSEVLLLGFGGVSKAILKALKDLKFKKIIVSARKKRNFDQLKISKNVKFCKWSDKIN